MENPTYAFFTSKTSSAGDVYVSLGYVPVFVRLTIGHDQTHPVFYEWYNTARPTVAGWDLSKYLKIAEGVTTVVSTAGQIIEAYAGGEIISTAETTDSTPKHVDRFGVAAPAGFTTKQGILIPSEIQVAGAKNILIAHRGDM